MHNTELVAIAFILITIWYGPGGVMEHCKQCPANDRKRFTSYINDKTCRQNCYTSLQKSLTINNTCFYKCVLKLQNISLTVINCVFSYTEMKGDGLGFANIIFINTFS